MAASVYAQAVALTRLLASPYWQALSASSSPARRNAFIFELRRTVAPGYLWPQPTRPADPLETWISERYLSGWRPALFDYHCWPALLVAST